MTTTTSIEKYDLEKFSLDFGLVNGGKIYKTILYPLTNREVGEALGYTVRAGHCGGFKNVKEGKYKASRFKRMCANLGVDPKEIICGYSPKVLQPKKNRLLEVDGHIKDAVLDAICDGL